MRIFGLALTLFLMGCGSAIPPTTGMVPAAQINAPGPVTERKVIDTVHLDLRVDAVDAVTRQLPAAVEAAKGYIAGSQLTQSQHTGSWTIRIPAEQVASFLDTAKTWGVVQSQRTTAEDVTEQFIDVSARLSSKRMEEDRLLKLLQESTGTLADVLAVEKELQRVRQEIEQTQGRVRYLEHATQFATVHLSVYELFGVGWSNDEPLGAQFVAVFRSSIHMLLLVARGLILLAAGLIPWLIVMMLPAILLWRGLRSPKRMQTHSQKL